MTFNLFKSSVSRDFLEGAHDVHSHLLPGVDDGFPTFEKTMEGLEFLKRHGFRKAKMTPHFMHDYGENTKAAIEAKYQDFIKMAGDALPIEVSLGGEYMLDSSFPDRLEEGFLTLDKEQVLVLCETSYMMMDPKAPDMIYRMMLKGYQPVIAHPERYAYASMALYDRWKEKEYLLQLNLFSLSGSYGKLAKDKAHRLLKEGKYDFVGTDLHRVNGVEEMLSSIRLSHKEMDQLSRLFENNKSL